jgi:ABC-2 type transport system ATP-binding protein
VTSPSIATRGLVKTFGPRPPVLDGVSLSAGTGVTAVVGPNGAGKTTLLRILATTLTPSSGQLTLLGHDPRRLEERTRIRRQLGYLPQEPALYRSFTVFAFLDYIALLKELTDRRVRHAEIWRVLEAVDLTHVATRKIRTLSAGMRQRVGLAQALLGDPALLVLDEPTDALDPDQRLGCRNLLAQLAQDRTIVLSTHQIDDAAALADTTVVLDRGRVRFAGPTTALTALGEGRVWVTDVQDPTASRSWSTHDGRHRNIGHPPAGHEPAVAQLQDAYFLLLHGPTPSRRVP